MDSGQRAIYESKSEKAREKLSALKQRIERKFPNQIRRYKLKYENGGITCLDKFKKLVLDDLSALFNHDLKSDERLNVNIRVRDKLHKEALDNCRFYFAAYDALNYSAGGLHTDGDGRYRYKAGSPQCGKSLSMLFHYAALYAFKNQNEPCWKDIERFFHDVKSVMGTDKSVYAKWLDGINTETTFPLYLQIAFNKDIKGDIGMMQTFLYFLNRHLDD